MVRTFIQTREFSRNWDKLGFKDEDLRKLELELLENSDLHPVIKGQCPCLLCGFCGSRGYLFDYRVF